MPGFEDQAVLVQPEMERGRSPLDALRVRLRDGDVCFFVDPTSARAVPSEAIASLSAASRDPA